MRLALWLWADGEAFVRASVAMEAIVAAVTERRATPPALAYIDTPTHVHIVPSGCAAVSSRLYSQRSGWQRAVQAVPGAGLLRPPRYADAAGCPWGTLLSAVSTAQGPNYALAKQIQRWRAIVARSDGQLVSNNIGPAARTESVMHAKRVAAAVEQLHHFPPNEVYDPATVCQVMAGLLVRDVCDPTAPANPSVALEHPLQLVADTAWHGGTWTAAFTLDSSAPAAFLINMAQANRIWAAPLLLGGMLWVGLRMAGVA